MSNACYLLKVDRALTTLFIWFHTCHVIPIITWSWSRDDVKGKAVTCSDYHTVAVKKGAKNLTYFLVEEWVSVLHPRSGGGVRRGEVERRYALNYVVRYSFDCDFCGRNNRMVEFWVVVIFFLQLKFFLYGYDG